MIDAPPSDRFLRHPKWMGILRWVKKSRECVDFRRQDRGHKAIERTHINYITSHPPCGAWMLPPLAEPTGVQWSCVGLWYPSQETHVRQSKERVGGMDQDQELAIGHMLEQMMTAVEANLSAIVAQLQAFDFAAHAVSETYFRTLVQRHTSAVQQAKLVAEALAHWGTMLDQGSRPDQAAL